jgi:predicted ATPase
MVYQETQEAMHAALWEAVRAGLISIRAIATNSCTTESSRRRIHYFRRASRRRSSDIGRKLLANMTAEELTEQLFEVANQFNRGAALIVDRDEKAQVATLNLRAGRKAKASAAYASARAYFASGMALLDERDWEQPVRVDVQPVARTRGVRASERQPRKSRATDCGVAATRGVESRPARPPMPEGPVAYSEGRTPASRRQRARVPALVRH